MKTKIKIAERLRNEIFSDIEQNAPRETMVFMLAQKIDSTVDTYLGRYLFRFEKDEIQKSDFSVAPKPECLERFYQGVIESKIFEKGYRIIEIHSHPFCSEKVSFSSIDWRNIIEDRMAYRRIFPGMEFVSVVFNRDMTSYDGRIVYPDKMPKIDEISFVGRDFGKLSIEAAPLKNEEMYSRMLLIPGFNLEKLQNLKLGLVGLGGIGSCIFQNLIMLGIGENNETIICDYDKVEASNLSRIPYASRYDIGKFKSQPAILYARKMRKERRVKELRLPCYEPEVQKELAACDLIIGATDSELAREFLNHVSTNFLCPLIDIGSGVVADEVAGREIVMSGCQVRTYIPGVNSCLFCNMGIDAGEVNSELAALFMNEKEEETLSRSGYLQNLTGKNLPEPSVYSLNQHAATLATDILGSYIQKGHLDDAVCFSQEALKITKLKARSNESCNYCGNKEFLCKGELLQLDDFKSKDDMPLPKAEAATEAEEDVTNAGKETAFNQ